MLPAGGCWFAHIDSDLSAQIIDTVLRPVGKKGKTLSYFCKYPDSLPVGVLVAACAANVLVPPAAAAAGAAPFERYVEFRGWIQRLLSYHGISFGPTGFYRELDPEDERGFRIVGSKRIVLQDPLNIYREFTDACRLRAQVLPELVRPRPRSDAEKHAMLKDILKEARDRELCCPTLKVRDLNAELFFSS